METGKHRGGIKSEGQRRKERFAYRFRCKRDPRYVCRIGLLTKNQARRYWRLGSSAHTPALEAFSERSPMSMKSIKPIHPGNLPALFHSGSRNSRQACRRNRSGSLPTCQGHNFAWLRWPNGRCNQYITPCPRPAPPPVRGKEKRGSGSSFDALLRPCIARPRTDRDPLPV